MVVFDSMNRAHWGIEVAEAVTASLSIPFVFKPAKIKSFPPYDNHLYADGGMVSNMPVWVFADEKLHYERRYLPRSKVMIVAFSLKADEDETVADGFQFLRYASAVARVAVFGGQQVVRRFISDLLAIELPVALRTTQFDFSMSHALEAYDAANRRASEILSQQTVTRPREARETMEWFRDAVLGRIGLQRPSASPTHLRIMLIKRSGDESFEVVESLNAENDADDRLLFSSFAEGAPSAFIQRRPVLLDIGGRWTDFDSLWATYGAFGPIGAFSPSVTKYEHALVRRSLKSAICVPIFGGSDASTAWEITNPLDRPEPVGIVSIDSDSDLTHVFRDNALMEVIAARSVVFGGILSSLGAQGHG
jgi:predicted acylesterase/phospholipase RssA